MASSEGEGLRLVDKFNGDNFSLWKFKMEMILSAKDLWDIVDKSELPPPSTADERDKKDYERRCKRAFAVIATNLVDKEMAHIKACKGPAEAWTTLCNIHEAKSLSNILFLRRKFFTVKMEEGGDMLDHINKVKSLADQLTCLDVGVKDEDVVMTLLESLPPSYEHLITALETRPVKELTVEFITSRLMHEVSKRKEREPQGEDAAMVSRQDKKVSSTPRQEARTCYKCGKPGHIARNCWSTKEVANNARAEVSQDDFVFVAHGGAAITSINTWIVDSGATQHMTPHKHAFDSYESISGRNVFMGDNGVVEVTGKGSIIVETNVEGQRRRIVVHDVLHVPKLHANLLSVGKLVSRGLVVQFNTKGCAVRTREGELIATSSMDANLYRLELKVVSGADVSCLAHTSANGPLMELWHRRMGHLNAKGVKALQGMANGMDLGKPPKDVVPFACEGCIEGKLARQPFPTDGAERATKVLELVHSDVCGPMKTVSLGGARYFLTFIDDYSRKVWVYVLKCKSEVLPRFKEWKSLVEKQSEHKVKVLRSDNGGEYTGKAFDEFLSKHGIARNTSAPYTPQQNGVAERANRTIVEMARSMLYAQELMREFWAEAVRTAVYTRNRCPSRALQGVTPEEAWSGKRPTISHMRVFGCVAYAKVPDERRTKLDAKAIKCVFLGYCEGTKAYRLICMATKKIIRSPHVEFMEDKEPLKEGPSGSDEGPALEVDNSFEFDGVEDFDEEPKPLENGPALRGPLNEDVEEAEDSIDDEVEGQPKEVVQRRNPSVRARTRRLGRDAPPLPAPSGDGHGTTEESRYSRRVRKPLGEWWKNHILPPRDVERANVAAIAEPHTMSEAINSQDASKWELAMQEEYDSLMANATWELAPLPSHRKRVGCKWVFRTKRDAHGNIVRYKARLVAKGFSQVEGVDFNETFAPVAKFSTIRCLLALGAAMDLEIHQMDVKTAFLNGELEEDVYMDQPPGFVQEGAAHLVCKLKKSLYGLKQSPRAWYEEFHAFFTREGFSRSAADHSLYIKQTMDYFMAVVIYVDDVILLVSGMAMMRKLKGSLEEEYDMSDLGELHFFLGVHIERRRAARTISMHQRSYIEGVLQRFGMADCKPIGTPLDPKAPLVKLGEEEEAQGMIDAPYKESVGCLMYAMVATRADLAFAVSVVSQFMSKPGSMHWAAVKRIMRYLKGTLDMKLTLGGKDISLRGYCDADWGGDANTRKSTTGYAFFIGEGAISWNSKRQPTVALSTTEAEYMAASQSAKEAIWLRQLMADVGCVQEAATIIMCDNQGCIALAKNPKHHSRTKHIDVQHHFIREKIEDEVIELLYCPTEHMVADVLTKALGRERHVMLTKAMRLESIDTSLSGSVDG